MQFFAQDQSLSCEGESLKLPQPQSIVEYQLPVHRIAFFRAERALSPKSGRSPYLG